MQTDCRQKRGGVSLSMLRWVTISFFLFAAGACRPVAPLPDRIGDEGEGESVAEDLFKQLEAPAGLVLAYRESGSWNVQLPGAWLVRHVQYVRTGDDTAEYTITLFVDDPGAHAVSVGEARCRITGTSVISAVNGFDPGARLKTTDTITTNDCTNVVGVTEDTMREVVQRSEQGEPLMLAAWHSGEDEEPAPSWVWGDGSANPYRPCPASAHRDGQSYCVPECDWDFLTDRSGDACPADR